MATLNLEKTVAMPRAAIKLDYRPKADAPPAYHRLRKPALTDAQTSQLAAHLLDDNAFDVLFRDDADVYRPDGSVLARFRQNVLSEAECAHTFPIWREAATETDQRGHAAGRITNQAEVAALAKRRAKLGIKVVSATHTASVKHDGTLSNFHRAKIVQSGITGYFDRSPRYPYCRLTAYNLDHPTRFAAVVPFLQKIDAEFARLVPDRYAAQREYVLDTSQDFRIHGTVFTTVTVNRNFQTAVHKDVGDLKQGFGVMSCLRRGRYDGCFFVFPKWRVAFDMRTGCVLCGDVHEWHGNTPIKGNAGMYERVSLVLYYREKMRNCGSAEEELARAKQRKPGTPAQLT
jgi:hypothetical protein